MVSRDRTYLLTIFTYRYRTNSRLAGITLLICEGAVFATSIDLQAYVPRLFFGALLTFIAIDLSWIGSIRAKTQHRGICSRMALFRGCKLSRLEGGMAIGFVITLLNFFFSYARIKRRTSNHHFARL